MVSYCLETHPVDASWAVGLSLRLLLRSLLLLRSRRLRSLRLRSLLLLLERSRRRRPILAPLRYGAALRARVKHRHSRAALKAGCSVPRRVISRARPVSWLEMIYSVTLFVALHLFTRARASQSDLAGVASVLQPLARLGFRGDNCASAACRRSPHGSPEAWKGWLAARRPSRPPGPASPSSCARPAHACKRFARPIAIARWNHSTRSPTGTSSTRPANEHEPPPQKAAANARAQRAAL